ncbi:PREDICTED: uncharacterized protein LOC108760275 [Trachymyrmex cornetzi]|uniref:uncharacterized protein LOC108760275 n=1 Tax=Trachymyrmex cornetzi TaxID=471704 RepID=UPI00084F1732|nr:PREDICTED: uncharacterized protein LOC108760275 [Trachymyrmex cornetzi]
MGYRISTPINILLAEVKECELSIRFNLTASKTIYKCMANKFSIVYNSLEEMELTAVRRNSKVKAIKESRLFKSYVTSRHEKSTVFRSTYPPAYWHSYKIFSTTVKFLSQVFRVQTERQGLLYGRIEESGRRSWCCGILAGAYKLFDDKC